MTRGGKHGNIVSVFLLLFIMLSPVTVFAGDGDTPQRLFSRPSGAGNEAPKAGSTGLYTLGFNPAVKVTGGPPINADAAFVMKVKEKWPDCNVERVCGGLAYLDCGSAMDGPAYYITAGLDIVATCGGVCMNPAEPCNCPPEEWTCN